MLLPNRHESSNEYRYSFNGMETDKEVSGTGNSYTTQFRQYDPRLGRWKSIDPLAGKFPSMSPFVAFNNNPIYFVDPLGLEGEEPNDGSTEEKAEKQSNVGKVRKDVLTKKTEQGDTDDYYFRTGGGRYKAVYTEGSGWEVHQKKNGEYTGLGTKSETPSSKTDVPQTASTETTANQKPDSKGNSPIVKSKETASNSTGSPGLTSKTVFKEENKITKTETWQITSIGDLYSGGIAAAAEETIYSKIVNNTASKYYSNAPKIHVPQTVNFSLGVGSVNVPGSAVVKVMNSAKIASRVLGGVGIAMTIIEIADGTKGPLEGTADIVMGLVAYAGPAGATVSIIYFSGKLLYQFLDGMHTPTTFPVPPFQPGHGSDRLAPEVWKPDERLVPSKSRTQFQPGK